LCSEDFSVGPIADMRRAAEYTQSRCPSSPLPRYVGVVGGELIRPKSRKRSALRIPRNIWRALSTAN
jgi:hypothetical protein